ncbi:hypothetical protein AFCDBAGC_5032 [Methylobacterium cerastii]|uniref:Recombinase domain-containing protein n=1 Tax=Methylobacterium cerastii TaxID=932741 RepID=A0ABQ4QPC4_9HYPH|nr:recombinase family protein [Methylobacterium cerastii]GJD47146.1 hypothetical protein AFCDBAGC_5032 [Methylobacterium cerastii]
MPVQRLAISYMRFSHRRQAKGDSIRRQIAACDRYVRDHGLTLLDTFTDKGVSAFRGKHATTGDLSRLLGMISAEKFGPIVQGRLTQELTLIIENIDRLSREPMMGALGRFTDLINVGVSIVCLDIPDKVFNEESINADANLLGVIVMMMSRGRNESQTKSTRVAESFNARFDQARIDGFAIKGYRGPAWLAVKDRRYVEHPDRCDVVREIYRLRIAGMGDYAIAAHLNERGVPTFPHCAKRSTKVANGGWYPSYVGKILASRAVLGEFDPRAAKNPFMYFPQVVSPSVWADAQAMRRTRATAAPGARGTKHHNVFLDMLRCAHCGGSMSMTQNRPMEGDKPALRYLQCSRRRRDKSGCTVPGMIPYSRMESLILDYLPRIPWGEIVERDNPDNPLKALDAEIARVRDELADLTEQNANLTSAVATARRPLPALLDALGETAVKVERAELRLKHLKNERTTKAAIMRPGLIRDATGFAESMKTATDTERYETRARLAKALSRIITRIDCDVKQKLVAVQVSTSFTILVFPLENHAMGFFPEDRPSTEMLSKLKPGLLGPVDRTKGPFVYLFGATPVAPITAV